MTSLIRHQLRNRHLERLREQGDSVQRRTVSAALDIADMATIHLGGVRKILLRHSSSLPNGAHPGSKSVADISFHSEGESHNEGENRTRNIYSAANNRQTIARESAIRLNRLTIDQIQRGQYVAVLPILPSFWRLKISLDILSQDQQMDDGQGLLIREISQRVGLCRAGWFVYEQSSRDDLPEEGQEERR